MNKLILLLFTGVFCSGFAFAQDDKQAAIAVTNRLFEAMKLRDAEKIRAVLTSDGQFVAIDKPRDGKGPSKTRQYSGEAFAKMISESKSPDYIEKMISPEAKVSGDLATVSGRYTFYLGDKFSHCGTDTFNLARTDAGWKIVQGAFTLEFQCD
ncbi:MAG TPA: nuclear transport factor 2 family protein, partial [Pyrinomonadaceae bacterium]|nr:nuclear transport factor 2 family protein [Pyrinomonadaceae bacterium]